MDSLSFLASLDSFSLLLFFWYAALLELPRYLIGALVLAVTTPWQSASRPVDRELSVSVLLVGHNEVGALRRCVTCLADQTVAHFPGRMQVVAVDDGSTDGMGALTRRLKAEGLVDVALSVAQRGGKSAGVNLALTFCHNDIVIICDIDTTLDRDAIEAVLRPFADPRVGAVSGDLGVRNATATLISRQQAIEYLVTISLGRRIDDMLGTLSIVSGAFGAFRRVAIEGVGGQDVEIGEDADLTLKLRRAGWGIRFAPEARAFTDVPETIAGLVTQRLRWDRGLVTIWLRKFRGNLDPRQASFRLVDLLALLDVLLFQVALPVTFPAYLIWICYNYGPFALTILGATLIGYALFSMVVFFIAAAFSVDTSIGLRLLPYMPLHFLTQIGLMRPVRLVALFQETVFRSSYRDPYVPARVMRQVERV
jgi:biofilm PGA synthesis N-glycosyltransferase PgaC